jgi:uncharacterized membrane protein
MIRTWLGMYAVAAGAFVLIDFVWLGFIAKPLYAKHMGDMLAPQPNMRAAVLFYAIFVAGLVFFVIAPALERGSWVWALGAGAFFGLVTYATWDLTNLAVLRDFPSSIVPIDMAWGTFLSAAVSLISFLVSRATHLYP